MEYALNIILSVVLLNITDLLNNYNETQLSQVILYQFQGYWLVIQLFQEITITMEP
jgi:hypothetical protein